MYKKSRLATALALATLATPGILTAQPYNNSVTALNPVGYWPLQETTLPPFGYYVATNLGTAGAVANGYYQTWYQPSGTAFYPTNDILRTTGATGDGDLALQCNRDLGPGQYVIFPRATAGVSNAALTIAAPFTVEAWIKSADTNLGLQPIVTEGRNSVEADPALGRTNVFMGFSLGQYKNFFYWQVYNSTRNQNGGHPEIDTAPLTPNTWYHVVAQCDGTNISLYLNGTLVSTKLGPSPNWRGNRYEPDPISPLLIGTGTEYPGGNGGVEYKGAIDEVAIYTNIVDASLIANHYSAGVGSTYATTVLGDNPTIYVRLNEPALTTYPDASTYPVANNLGLLGAAANGVYQLGTTPGVPGPSYTGFGASSHAVAFNGFFGNVDVGHGALPAEFNPTNNQPLTVAAWFKGNPTDDRMRYQILVGHSDSSWRLGFGGANGDNHFNPGPSSAELQFASVAEMVTNGFYCNDGNWHFVVGTTDGTNEAMYIDGLLAKTNTTPQAAITGSSLDFLIGGDPTYLTPTYNTTHIRTFAGSIAHVAFWTNALSAADVQGLYTSAGNIPPVIHLQPTSVTTNQGSVLRIPTTASGASTLTYQWYRNGTPVSGQTSAILTLNPALPAQNGSYFVVASNPYGNATSTVVTVTVLGPPVLQQQSPTDVKVFVATSPILRADVTGPTPYYYQWSRNGSAIPNGTNATYRADTTAVGSSTYTCAITNAFSAGTPTTISPITVAVSARPTAPYPVTVLNDSPANYFRLDEPDNLAGNNGVTAYDRAGGLNAYYTNTALSQPGYTALTDTDTAAAFSGTRNSYAGGGSPYLSYAAPVGSNAQFSVEAWINETAVQLADNGIVAAGYGYGGEQYCLDFGANNAARNLRFYVNDASGVTHTASSTFTPVDGLWHHIVGVCDQANAQVRLYVDGTLAGTGSVTNGSGIRSLTLPLSIGARVSRNTATDYDNQFTGGVDEVAVYGYALTATQVLNHYYAAGIAPAITQQPTNYTANAGSTATFSVVASGTPNLAYQWYDVTSGPQVPVPNQTNATMVLTGVTRAANDGHVYQVVVTNLYGQASTDPVALTVIDGPPYISADISPLSDTVKEGTPYSYTVAVGGSAPFRYQWYLNGSPIANATNATYAFEASAGTNAYYVHVSNTQGSTDSSTATLIGTPVPKLNPMAYGYRMKVQFTGYNRGEALPNFPALVKFSPGLGSFSYSQFLLANGSDLRFTDSSGFRMIPHEIEAWNDSNGVSTVWVQLPTLASTNDYVYAYWGNATPEAALNATNVWLPDFTAVYHLKESGLPYADSTGQYNATGGVAPAPEVGIAGFGQLFTGGNYIDSGAVTLSNMFTVSAWVNCTAGANSIQGVWANGPGGWNGAGYRFYVNNWNTQNGALVVEVGDGTTGNELDAPPGTVPAGGWHLVTLVADHDGGTAQLYADGTFLASRTTVKDAPLNSDANIGRFSDGAFGFNGVIDETRIATTTNSPARIWADYQTVAHNNTFQTYSGVTGQRNLGYTVSGGNLVLSWSSGTLQAAGQVYGTYTNVPNATSPLSVPISGPQLFYRVKVQ